MIDEKLDAATVELAEARAKIEAARAGLLKAGDAQEVRAAIQRLDRIESELKRVEASVVHSLAGLETANA